jgi:2-keto-4-pentenoate hydratase/2-oxohepta-3-ene-1,7-dioic acid hydratase in catechol pathway
MAKTNFKLATLTQDGTALAAMATGKPERLYPIAELLQLSGGHDIPITIRDMLEQWERAFARLSALADRIAMGWEQAEEIVLPRDALNFLAPVQPPGQIFQAAANFRSHVWQIECSWRRNNGMSAEEASNAEERAAYDARIDQRVLQDAPYIFMGNPHSISGAFDDVVLPARFGQMPDWEVELGAIFAGSPRYVRSETALDYVAGYVVCNDVSHRPDRNKPPAFSLGTDWLTMKNSPGFFPTGPYLVPAAFIDDPMKLQITMRLNGQIHQDESTADMIYDLRQLISHLSFATVVRPGDMLITGSPSGNAIHSGRYLQPGDVMEAEVSGLGMQRTHVIQEEF